MLRVVVGFGIAVLSLPLSAMAEEIRADSVIKAVTVFPSGADVMREAHVALPAGDSTVVIANLPSSIESDSLKVEGTGDQVIEIGSVETKAVPAGEETDPKRKALLDEIEGLQDRLAGIDDKIDALDGRKDFVVELSKKLPEGFAKALSQPLAGSQNWGAASQMIGDDLARIADEVRALRVEQRTVKQELKKKKEALDELPPPADQTEVRIELATTLRALGTLRISYRVPAAQWAPAYDALLSTGEAGGDPKLAIVRRAEVTQETGEDWSGVALTLSTARPTGGTALPTFGSTLVSLMPEYDYSRDKSMASAPPPPAASMPLGDAEAGEAPAERPVTMVEATADFGDFRAEYRVPGSVSVASGEGARLLRIATVDVPAALEVKAAPALSPSAFLNASFDAPEGAPLLAGKVSLFRDGAFVGAGSLAFTNAGAKVDLGFGADDGVKVTRTELDHATGETGLLSARKTDTSSYRITVENLHKRPVKITVLDRVPYAEDEQITVERLAETTAPTAEDVDDQRGLLAWTYDYQPGESRDLKIAYQVSWPASEEVVFGQ